MSRYLQRSTGQMNGSIGDGRDRIPSPAALPTASGEPEPVESAVPWSAVAAAVHPVTVVRVVDVVDRGVYNYRLCDHCGSTIRYEAHVLLSDDTVQVWGTTCAGLVDSDRDAELDRSRRRASRTAIDAWIAGQPHLTAALAAYDAYLAQVTATLDALFVDLPDPEQDGRYWWARERLTPAPRVEAAVDAIRTWGPTVREQHLQTVLDAHTSGVLDTVPAVGPLPTHVGVVGQRVTVTVTVDKRILLPPYCYGATAPVLLVAHDADGNRLVTKTTAAWAYPVQPGTPMTWTGTVKAHTTYDDLPQTVLTRVKAA